MVRVVAVQVLQVVAVQVLQVVAVAVKGLRWLFWVNRVWQFPVCVMGRK
jgi:hypothetical protein